MGRVVVGGAGPGFGAGIAVRDVAENFGAGVLGESYVEDRGLSAEFGVLDWGGGKRRLVFREGGGMGCGGVYR